MSMFPVGPPLDGEANQGSRPPSDHDNEGDENGHPPPPLEDNSVGKHMRPPDQHAESENVFVVGLSSDGPAHSPTANSNITAIVPAPHVQYAEGLEVESGQLGKCKEGSCSTTPGDAQKNDLLTSKEIVVDLALYHSPQAMKPSPPRSEVHTPVSNSSFAKILGRRDIRTPNRDDVFGLPYIGEESVNHPGTWICGRCEERSIGKFCHNCGAECLLLCFSASPKK